MGDADLHELILYATPTGELADSCREYWRRADEAGRTTTAQSFPPHCTLTGFFHRGRGRVAEVVAEAAQVAEEFGSVEVADVRLESHGDWVGLGLDSDRLASAIDRFVELHRVFAGEDRLRPKSWLHLSLAYGDGVVPAWHAELAATLVQPCTVPWTIGLWRRAGARWERLDLGSGVGTPT